VIEIALAFAAGVLTAAARCILPILPVLLAPPLAGPARKTRARGGCVARRCPGGRLWRSLL